MITRPDAVHICYCHTPTRYVWDFYYTYRNNANALVRAVMPGQMLKLRQWDKCAADRVDYFIANSHYIAKRIKKYYRRDSDVIYPCVHINEEPFVPKEDFYLVVGRFTWYKRIDLAVAACTKLNKPLIVIGGGGEGDKLRAMAGPTIRFLGGGLSDEEVRGYMQKLSETGTYTVSDRVLRAVQAEFSCGFCTDAQGAQTIGKTFRENHYLLDTHTAVACTVLDAYRSGTGDQTLTVVESTASPFKFCASVLDALGVTEHAPGTGVLAQLTAETGRPAPTPLASLAGKPVRFDQVTDRGDMRAVVTEFLR